MVEAHVERGLANHAAARHLKEIRLLCFGHAWGHHHVVLVLGAGSQWRIILGN